MPIPLRRPTKAPPPPPLPPPPLPRLPTFQHQQITYPQPNQVAQSLRCGSTTARSCYSYHAGSSECGGYSVCSMPIVANTFSPQSSVRSPTFYSCKSESGRSNYFQPCCCCQDTNQQAIQCCETSSVYSACSQPVSSCQCSGHENPDGHTTNTLPIGNPVYNYNNNTINHITTNINSLKITNEHGHSNHNLNNNCKSANCINMNVSSANRSYNHQGMCTQLPPIPPPSISPMPTLKNVTTKQGERKSRLNCNSFHYRRHIEQHVERIFKYLRERENRRQEVELEIANIQEPETFRDYLVKKESYYLRSLRMKTRPDDFQFISALGKGYIGNVSLVKIKNHIFGPKVFAMKKLKKSQVIQQNHIAHIMAERDILAEADKDCIVKLYYSFQDKNFLYFILEYVPGGDLMNLLSLKNVFPENWARFYIAEISIAVQFVHDMGFIHRDIKPDNILIDARGHIKLTDFGLCTGFRWTHDSKYYREETINNLKTMQMNNNNHNNNNNNNNGYGYDDTDFVQNEHGTITNALTQRHIIHAREKRSLSLVGSPNYIAPEVLRQAFDVQGTTDERLCDWWSVGVILYEMVIGYCPFIDLEKLKNNTYSPSTDPPQFIQQRIVNWKNYLRFPNRNDPDSPPLMAEILNPRVFSEQDQDNYKLIYDDPKFIQPATENLIKSLLCDPENRLNGREIKQHPFFNQIEDWETINQTPAPYIPHLRDEEDTSHFSVEQYSTIPTESENQLGTTLTTSVNDFTYKSFWRE